MIYVFLFIILAASTNSCDVTDGDKTTRAVTEYMNGVNSWEPMVPVSILDLCATHQITLCHFMSFIIQIQNKVLSDLQDLIGEIEIVTVIEVVGDDPEAEIHQIFLDQIDAINIEWPNLNAEIQAAVLEYFKALLDNGSEWEVALVNKIRRELPTDMTCTRRQGILFDVRAFLGGVNALFLVKANAEEPIENPYLACLFAFLKLTNLRNNKYLIDHFEELEDDFLAWETAQIAYTQNVPEEEFIILFIAALDVIEATIIKVSEEGFPPDFTALSEYLLSEAVISNECLLWLITYVGELGECNPNGFYFFLQTLLCA